MPPRDFAGDAAHGGAAELIRRKCRDAARYRQRPEGFVQTKSAREQDESGLRPAPDKQGTFYPAGRARLKFAKRNGKDRRSTARFASRGDDMEPVVRPAERPVRGDEVSTNRTTRISRTASAVEVRRGGVRRGCRRKAKDFFRRVVARTSRFASLDKKSFDECGDPLPRRSLVTFDRSKVT